MTNKSHVTLEQRQCVVCGNVYDTGALLLNKRLRNVFAQHTLTGYGLCPEHDALHKRGYCALIECANDAQPAFIEDVVRTGQVLHVPYALLHVVLNIAIDESQPIALVGQGFIEQFVTQATANGLTTVVVDHTNDASNTIQ